MPAQPLQFVHAANVFLDRALRISLAVPAGVRDTVEEATLIAFQNLVQFCCDDEVDFLLLTGNTFCESDRSLAARVALLRGLQTLDEAGINTFVLPGDHDPLAAWRSIPGLPASVTVLDPDESDPIAIEGNGNVLATVEATSGFRNEAAASPAPFRIGLRMGTQEWLKWQPESLHPNAAAGRANRHTASDRNDESSGSTDNDVVFGGPFHYLALGGDSGRTTLRTDAGLIHHPGLPQGHSPTDIGFCGATLLEWTAGQSLQAQTVSTAAVRFERMSTGISRLSTAAELKQTMLEQLAQHPPADGERVRFITWRLTGAGPLLPLLHNANALRDLSHDVATSVASAKTLHPVIQFDLSDLLSVDTRSDASLSAEFHHRESSLVAEFHRELQSLLLPQDLTSRWEMLARGDRGVADRLHNLTACADSRVVSRLAERLGAERLTNPATKGAPA